MINYHRTRESNPDFPCELLFGFKVCPFLFHSDCVDPPFLGDLSNTGITIFPFACEIFHPKGCFHMRCD